MGRRGEGNQEEQDYQTVAYNVQAHRKLKKKTKNNPSGTSFVKKTLMQKEMQIFQNVENKS